MPSTPILGLPFPAATDPVAQGAAAIQALAESNETLDTAFFTAKLTAAGSSLLIPAGTFPTRFAAIEIGAMIFQAGSNDQRTPWAFRCLPASGTYWVTRSGNAGSGAPAMGSEATTALAQVSNIWSWPSRGTPPGAYFKARIEAPSEARSHLVTFEWFCQTNQNAALIPESFGNGWGHALVPSDWNAAGVAITGFEIFAQSGPGFGANSTIWARGIGARTAGYS